MEEYLDRIQAEFFEPINSYKIIQEGWTNLVIEINEQWIFRFVRDRENTQIAVERDFLPIFAKVSPVNIPNLAISGDDYIAYRKIAGARFSSQNFLLFSHTQKANLFKLLGQFLTCLHNFQFTHQYLSEAPYGGSNFWNDLWLPVKDNLSEQTRNKVEELLNYYQREIENNFWARIEYESKRKMFFAIYFALNHGFATQIPTILEYIEKLFQNQDYK